MELFFYCSITFLTETPLPEPKETSVWTVFGLSAGIASMISGIFTCYAVILAGAALFMSVIGFARDRAGTLGIASIICSTAGMILSIVMEAVRNIFFENISLTSLIEFLHL